MEILRNSDINVINILGEPEVKIGTNKRFIKNCLYFDIDDGKVLMNSLTKAIVFIKDDEFDKIGDINTYSFLYKNYFFVNEDFDEWDAFEKVRKTRQKPVDDLYLNHPLSFTILTTTKCNARCAYCYEKTIKRKSDMTEETALKVAEYILKVTPKNVPAELSWFGGEPLYNAKIINIISDYLRDNGKQFYSGITTNGYLFDDRLVKKAKNSWNVTFVQITIDGIEEDYNKIKNYIYKDQISPYKKVINSIKSLIKENIKVDIRVNIDPKIVKENPDYYENLIYELHNILKDSLKIYIYPLFDDDKLERTEEENENLYNYLCYLENILDNFNCSGHIPNKNLTTENCMADNGSSIIINTDGKFALCEHYIGENFSDIDHIFEKDLDMIKSWKEYMNNRELCDSCPILGDCYGLSKCPDYRKKCPDYRKKWNIIRYLNGLKKFYYFYRKNNKLNDENNIKHNLC